MSNYSQWSKEALIEHIVRLEASASTATTSSAGPSNPDTKPNSTLDEKDKGTPTLNHTKKQKGKKTQNLRPFDFTKHSARPIALKVAYLGWNYHGLAAQETGSGIPTIESALFQALYTARLIPDASGNGCNWTRCGRTDRGVSSFGQVVSCLVRSNLPIGAEGTYNWPSESEPELKRKRGNDDDEDNENEGEENVHEPTQDLMDVSLPDKAYTPVPEDFSEIQYVARLNHILPPDIRILAWSPVAPQFSSRFDCTFRRYRYFFPAEGLDLKRMQEAAKLYIGAKDYRHFCKVDPSKNVKTYVRTVLDASVEPMLARDSNLPTTSNFLVPSKNDEGSETKVAPESFLVFEVKGHAFLWHQVRCMTAILHLIGRGLEPVSLINDLTDLSKHPDNAGRPIYGMASEIPLVLVECGFSDGALDWRVDAEPISQVQQEQQTLDIAASYQTSDAFSQLIVNLWGQWREHSIKAAQVEALLQQISVDSFNSSASNINYRQVFDVYARDGVLGNASGESGGYGGKSTKSYIPIMKRKRCDSIEDRTVKYNASKQNKQAKQAATVKNGAE
ncbi:tRNA pseudouridine synthase 3 [Chytriomyces hyalinus]|nr:tRNA pseudouridine synthase 3 [Chytriomyces hyalinus]